MHGSPFPTYEMGLEGEQRDGVVVRVLSGAKTSRLLVHLRLDGDDLPLPGQRYALMDSTGV